VSAANITIGTIEAKGRLAADPANPFYYYQRQTEAEYVDSDFESINYRSEVEKLLYEFAKVCKHYYQISIYSKN